MSFSSFVCRSSRSFLFLSEIFVSNFEFVFSFRCSIRFLEFLVEFRIRIFVSSFYSISRISRRISNFLSKFSFRCSIRFLEFRFEFVAEFDFSKLLVKFDFSNSRLFDSYFEFECLDFSSSNLSSNFEFVLLYSISRISLLYSTSRTSIRICRRNLSSNLSSKLLILN